MSCKTPQLVMPVDGKAIEVPCGICYGCDVDRRMLRRKRFFEFRSRIRNYGGV